MSTDDPDPADADDNRRILRTLWEPHPGQQAVMQNDSRFRVVACGRRWGKSEMCAHLALERALESPGTQVWWVGPTYGDANDYGFDKMIPLLSPDVVAGEPKRSMPRGIELVNGSTISFRSAEREDSLRGAGVDFLILDETAAIPERAWTEELRPTLSDTLGDAIFIGTPKGRNWFYRWYQRGQSTDPNHDDVASWRAATYQNPHVPDSEIDAARDDMPERAFKQEYLAEFVDASGGVFEQVRERAVEDYQVPVLPNAAEAPFAIGVDFARMSNWTVVVVLDVTARVVAFDRLQQTTWTRIQQRVEHLAEEYEPHTACVDATRDNKIVSDLEGAGVNVEPVSFSRQKKQVLIENLITRLEAEELTIPTSANQLINELEVFEYDMSDSGRVQYSAPAGFHDDCVDACALASEAIAAGGGGDDTAFLL